MGKPKSRWKKYLESGYLKKETKWKRPEFKTHAEKRKDEKMAKEVKTREQVRAKTTRALVVTVVIFNIITVFWYFFKLVLYRAMVQVLAEKRVFTCYERRYETPVLHEIIEVCHAIISFGILWVDKPETAQYLLLWVYSKIIVTSLHLFTEFTEDLFEEDLFVFKNIFYPVMVITITDCVPIGIVTTRYLQLTEFQRIRLKKWFGPMNNTGLNNEILSMNMSELILRKKAERQQIMTTTMQVLSKFDEENSLRTDKKAKPTMAFIQRETPKAVSQLKLFDKYPEFTFTKPLPERPKDFEKNPRHALIERIRKLYHEHVKERNMQHFAYTRQQWEIELEEKIRIKRLEEPPDESDKSQTDVTYGVEDEKNRKTWRDIVQNISSSSSSSSSSQTGKPAKPPAKPVAKNKVAPMPKSPKKKINKSKGSDKSAKTTPVKPAPFDQKGKKIKRKLTH